MGVIKNEYIEDQIKKEIVLVTSVVQIRAI